MPNKCKAKRKDHCNGKDVRLVQLSTKLNTFNGEIIYCCAGCRRLMNGGFKYADKTPKKKEVISRSTYKLMEASYNAGRSGAYDSFSSWVFARFEIVQYD